MPNERCWEEPREKCASVPEEKCWDEPKQHCRKGRSSVVVLVAQKWKMVGRKTLAKYFGRSKGTFGHCCNSQSVCIRIFFSRSGSGFEFFCQIRIRIRIVFGQIRIRIRFFFARSGFDYCLVQKSFQYMKLRDWTSYIGF